VVPAASAKLLDGLGQAADARTFRSLGEPGRLRGGTAIPPPAGVFPRYIESEGETEPKAKEQKPAKKK
jgi:methionyl-tRNA synthetase